MLFQLKDVPSQLSLAVKDVPSYSRLDNYNIICSLRITHPDTNRLKLHTYMYPYPYALSALRCAILAESCCERCAILQQAR